VFPPVFTAFWISTAVLWILHATEQWTWRWLTSLRIVHSVGVNIVVQLVRVSEGGARGEVEIKITPFFTFRTCNVPSGANSHISMGNSRYTRWRLLSFQTLDVRDASFLCQHLKSPPDDSESCRSPTRAEGNVLCIPLTNLAGSAIHNYISACTAQTFC
jgi:hypothetical protein